MVFTVNLGKIEVEMKIINVFTEILNAIAKAFDE